MKFSTIFRKAARLITEGKCARSCFAVARAQGHLYSDKSPARDWYEDRILSGCPITFRLFSTDCAIPGYGGDDPRDHRVRILALLLAAEIAKSEGL